MRITTIATAALAGAAAFIGTAAAEPVVITEISYEADAPQLTPSVLAALTGLFVGAEGDASVSSFRTTLPDGSDPTTGGTLQIDIGGLSVFVREEVFVDFSVDPVTTPGASLFSGSADGSRAFGVIDQSFDPSFLPPLSDYSFDADLSFSDGQRADADGFGGLFLFDLVGSVGRDGDLVAGVLSFVFEYRLDGAIETVAVDLAFGPAPVPLPAAGVLFAGGLIGACAFRRRQALRG